jgi:D-glycero-alpha-D-manno-heptose-7-phosphate kinase
MIISRTPFRISFFGGGTDFEEFYRNHGGAVLCTTINKYCYISLHNIGQFFDFKYRASYAKTESVLDPHDFQHPLIRECLLHLGMEQGVEISHVSDLPGRTGLGTSSSFTVGLLNALHALRGERATAEDLARDAIHVERERVGDTGGHQDQYAAAYGGFIRVDFHRTGTRVCHISLGADRIQQLESHLLVFCLGVEQSAEHILKEQNTRTAQNIHSLLEMKRMVDDAEQILISGTDLCAFGTLLHESWQRKKQLSQGISNTAIDTAYDTARKAGALGGKLLGAGGRGFLLVFAKPEDHEKVRTSMKVWQEIQFAFSQRGSSIIFQSTDS